jgi:tetratricopeptide (TPR) repeat protein
MLRILAILVIGLTAGSAQAEKPRDEARRHFRAAEAHMQHDRYEEAIAEYRAAYALVSSPALLYNIAQAYRRKGDTAAALEHYRMYLDKAPDGEAAAAAREHIAALAPVNSPAPAGDLPTPATPAQPAPSTSPAAPTLSPPVEQAPSALAAQSSAAALHAAAPSLRDTPTTGSGSGLRTAGLVAGGIGVAGVAAGIYFGVRAATLSDRVSRTYEASDDRAGKAANRNMIISYSIGGTGIAAGVVLYYLGWRRRASVVSAVTVDPSGIILAWSY